MSAHRITEAIRIRANQTPDKEHSSQLYLTSSFCYDDAEDMRDRLGLQVAEEHVDHGSRARAHRGEGAQGRDRFDLEASRSGANGRVPPS